MSGYSATLRIVCGTAFVCASAASAAAQATRVIGPFAGLFGGDKGERSQSLDIRASVFGSYDRDVVTGVDAPTLANSGLLTGAFGAGGGEGTIEYQRRGPRVRFGLDGGGGFSRSDAGATGGTSYTADSTLGANLTPKLVFDAHAQVAHTPYYLFAPGLTQNFTTAPIPLTPGYGMGAADLPTTLFYESVSLADNFSRRSNVTAEVHWNQTRFGGPQVNGELQNFREFGLSALFNHHISRRLSFHFGYGREQLQEGAPAPAGASTSPAAGSATSPIIQTADIGIDYSDTVTSHRVTLAVTTSTAIVRFAGETHYRIDGSLTLSRGLRRTWEGSVQYVRGTEFVPGFGQPLLTDAVSGVLTGLVTPRVNSSTTAGYSFGHVGYDATSGFGAFEGSSTLESAITRRVGIFVSYSFYRYTAPIGETGLPLLPRFSHHSVTVGLTAWHPIITPRRGQ